MNRVADILVVDDEPVVLMAARKALPDGGLTVDTAGDGEEALRKLHRSSYAAVLSDLMLPGIDGIELTESIHKLHPETPVVIITGYATLSKALESFRRGAFDFLPKPFDMDELLSVSCRAVAFAGLDPSSRRSIASTELRSPELPLLSLGQHSWVRLRSDGVAEVGLGESFRGLGTKLQSVEFPELHDAVLQANECMRVLSEEGLFHRVWAPLSGTIVGTNPAWEQSAPAPGPGHDRWLLQIAPSDLVNELEHLTPR